jgi:hypothetical protein
VRLSHRSRDGAEGAEEGSPVAARVRRGSSRKWLLASLAAAVVLLLVLAQLVLPSIATERVREEVGRYGSVRTVHVHAVPAIALLWGSADEITVTAGPLRMTPHALVGLEQKLGGVGSARLSAPRLALLSSSLTAGEIPLEDAVIEKHGNALTASGTVRASEMQVALPAGLHVDGLYAESGRPEVAVSGEAFGVHVGGRALVRAKGGAVVVELPGVPFGGLATLTLFSDPRIHVESVTAIPHGEGIFVALHARPSG